MHEKILPTIVSKEKEAFSFSTLSSIPIFFKYALFHLLLFVTKLICYFHSLFILFQSLNRTQHATK